MSLVFDEYGRPFIIVRGQDKKDRKKGAVQSVDQPIVGAAPLTGTDNMVTP
jgi:hypothetical protein